MTEGTTLSGGGTVRIEVQIISFAGSKPTPSPSVSRKPEQRVFKQIVCRAIDSAPRKYCRKHFKQSAFGSLSSIALARPQPKNFDNALQSPDAEIKFLPFTADHRSCRASSDTISSVDYDCVYSIVFNIAGAQIFLKCKKGDLVNVHAIAVPRKNVLLGESYYRQIK